MFIFKKPENIVPFLISFLGLFCIYDLSILDTSLSAMNKHFILNHLQLNFSVLGFYIDIINRVILGITIIYVMYLYNYRLKSMPFVIGFILILYIIFYVELAANIIHLNNIDFFLLNFLSLILWDLFFLRTQTLFNLVLSFILLAMIAFINPYYSIFLSFGIVLSTIIHNYYNSTQYIAPSFVAILISFGFSSFALSLILSNKLQDFFILLLNNAYLALSSVLILLLIVLCKYWYQKEIISKLSENSKIIFMSHAVIIFFGSILLARSDYIIHY